MIVTVNQEMPTVEEWVEMALRGIVMTGGNKTTRFELALCGLADLGDSATPADIDCVRQIGLADQAEREAD
ncbi:MAG: hypothetical protein FWG08_01850 [Propionibacteriaceae bacterium]|nr:hypothetical protein [Propionibacteriaceae bacterium]